MEPLPPSGVSATAGVGAAEGRAFQQAGWQCFNWFGPPKKHSTTLNKKIIGELIAFSEATSIYIVVQAELGQKAGCKWTSNNKRIVIILFVGVRDLWTWYIGYKPSESHMQP